MSDAPIFKGGLVTKYLDIQYTYDTMFSKHYISNVLCDQIVTFKIPFKNSNPKKSQCFIQSK